MTAGRTGPLLSQLSRRSILKGGAGLAASAAAGSLWMPRPARAAPKKGGDFKLGIASGSTTDSLDPGTYADNYMQSVGHALHNFLTEVTNTGELQGELAESWEASPDARTWTFKIRKGVEFHDGKSLTPADVVASMEHHRGEGSTSAATSLLDPVTEVKADGDVVVFTLAAGNADFPYLVSDYHLAILPASDGKVDPTSGVGCGAYKLKSFEPGVRTLVEKNGSYWKSDRGWFDTVEFLVIADVVARTNAMATGEIHAMNRIDLKTVSLLERNKALEIYSVNGGQHYTLPMNTQAAPFDDKNVRMALKYAIDRQVMLDTLLRGYGEIGNDQPVTAGYKFFNAELPQRGYDPDKAKFHLRQAGLDSLKVDLSASDAAFAGAVDAAVLFKEQAAKAGIEVNVVREPADGYWDSVWLKKPFCMSYWGGKPTADWALTIGYAKDAAWNDTHWDNERFNTLLVAARAELDEARRTEMYAEMQTLLNEDGGVILPVFANYNGAISTRIGHDTLASNWDLDGLRAAERWWFAS
ncbi:ABC transporter substrate-binding protein [Mangrovibrevibacter kandeliae]|uniref:ABC transporter substrate-binding protein n=1 Tax=Mangrovibrevibacter kandeliae TaxID=2968473 RepID=UPI0021174A64|nr:ABC transporter substrate-binding protein [Aurantimonas sp. CSK15Z-1]MCQ8784007.1 ABC transporter substrate-binding protein [Aurantimonas sp. CSK15Z-1]